MRRPVMLIIAMIIALLGTSLIVLYVRGIDARATEGQEMVEVLAASATIEMGEKVSSAMEAGKLEKRSVRKADVVEGALTNTSSISNDVALSTVYPGEQLVASRFGSPSETGSLSIPDDKLAVSVELTDSQRVAGFVQPGSEVAIFISGEPTITSPDGSSRALPSQTRLLLPKVEVIGVGTTAISSKTTKTDGGDQVVEQVPSTILTVAVSQKDAEKLIFASRTADISFALLSSESRVVDQPGVSAGQIFPEAAGSN